MAILAIWHFGIIFFLFRFFVLKENMSCVNRCCLVVCSWLNCTFVWKTSGLNMTLVKVLDGLIPVSHMTLQAWCWNVSCWRNCQTWQVGQIRWCTYLVSGFAGGVSCARKLTPNVPIPSRRCVLQINIHLRDSQKLGWHQLEGRPCTPICVYVSFFTFILSSCDALWSISSSGKDLGANCHVGFRLRKGSFRGFSAVAPHIRFVPPTETLVFFSTFVTFQSPAEMAPKWPFLLQKRVWNTCLHFVSQVFFFD